MRISDWRSDVCSSDLLPAADAGRFRPDLLDRLSFEVITLPPLRAREGDVAVLADHFGRRMAAEIGWPQWPGFSAACMAELEAHAWPGNVRELRNVVERAVYRWNEPGRPVAAIMFDRSEEHTSELQSLMRISYAVFCLKTKNMSDHSQQHAELLLQSTRIHIF